ncbi:MAG TPA: response regulator [Phycisphaerae bacterium]
MEPSSATATVVAVIDDLIFETKIRATARAVGVEVRTARDAASLEQLLDQAASPLVLVDLNLPNGGGPRAVASAAAHATRPYLIAFVSHVQADLARAGLLAGAHQVLPRSRFAVELSQLLQEHGPAPPDRAPEPAG